MADHPELQALAKLLSAAIDIYVANGNAHVSYWTVEQVVGWKRDADFEHLRGHFTMPRLLAGFSLFDHNFTRKTCALSPRNYAVFGADRVVRARCLQWQHMEAAEPVTSEEMPAGSAPSFGAGGAGREAPGCGEFLSVVDCLRYLRWNSTFGPHIGDFLEFAWRTPGLELGVRVSSAAFASKDAQVESRDLSEKAALQAVVARLAGQKGQSEHIASLRQCLSWKDYGLGSLEKFVRKYYSWFTMDDERICLKPEKAGAVAPRPEPPGGALDTQAPQGALPGRAPSEAALSASGESTLKAAMPAACRAGGGAGGGGHEDEDDEDEDEGQDDAGVAMDEAQHTGRAAARERCARPVLFQMCGEASYHELSHSQALRAPLPAAGAVDLARAAKDGVPTMPPGSADKIGSEVLAYAQANALTEGDWEQRQQVRERVERGLRAIPQLVQDHPKLRVSVFGTSATGLGEVSSDLDLLLELDGEGNRELCRDSLGEILRLARQALADSGADDLQVVAAARVPLVRGRLQALKFDLTIGSSCGVWNSALLRDCAAVDPGLVIPLCITTAAWSKARGINDSPNGLLSTYSVMLLVVFYLQVMGELPALDPGQLSTEALGAFARSAPPFLAAQGTAPARIGTLLVGFFSFVVTFKWDAWVAAPRCGGGLMRTQKPRVWQVHPLCIEDPLETHLNTCRRVNPRGCRLVLTAAGAALRSLLSGEGIDTLLGLGGAGAGAEAAVRKSRARKTHDDKS